MKTMSKLLFLVTLFSLLIMGNANLYAQKKGKESGTKQSAMVQSTFKVAGNCIHCKVAIENAVKSLPGVKKSNWSLANKQLMVSYDSTKVSLPLLHKAIAKIGYDTDLEKGDDAAYSKLPDCCKYRK